METSVVGEATQINGTDLWVTIATVLLTLSLIAEMIANLIKLTIPATRNKKYSANEEKRRELQVIIIAIPCGLVTSFLAGADFFTLLSEGKLIAVTKQIEPKQIIGLIRSGLFISMGSKFWHDLLDIAVQFSNLKKFKTESQAAETLWTLKQKSESDKEDLRNRVTVLDANFQNNLANYRGFNVLGDPAGVPEVQLFFKDSLPDSATRDKIKQYLLNDKVSFNKSLS